MTVPESGTGILNPARTHRTLVAARTPLLPLRRRRHRNDLGAATSRSERLDAAPAPAHFKCMGLPQTLGAPAAPVVAKTFSQHARPARARPFPVAGALVLLLLPSPHALPQSQPARPFPWEAAWSPDGSRLAVSDRARNRLHLLPASGAGLRAEVPLQGSARGVAWSGARVWVAEYDAGTVAEVDAASARIVRRLAVGPKPMGLALAGETLLVAEYGLHQLIGVDLKTGAERFRLPVQRHPVAVAATPDGRLALAAGLLPPGAAGPEMAGEVVLVDVALGKAVKVFVLPDGSSNVRGIAVSRDGRLAAVVHTRGRTALPTTQIDRGWINTNVITLVDLRERKLIATCVLDAPAKGAADPWGAGFLPDGSVWITLAGAAELMHFDLPRFERLLTGRETLPPEKQWPPGYWDRGTMPHSRTAPQRWAEIAKNPELRTEFANNLALLSGIDLTRRVDPGLAGPRAVAPDPSGTRLAVVAAFDRQVAIVDAGSGAVLNRLALADGPAPAPTAAELGERLFFDGRVCFQGWMSCSTCHHEARTDGLNWDLMNDGIGTAKNTKSMLLAPRTPPMTWTAAREGCEESIRKGFHFLLYEPEDAEAANVLAYFESLAPEPSPHLERAPGAAPALSAAAQRGRAAFEDAKCGACHSGDLFTNLKPYDVGTGGVFDTPSLVEAWRTAPYLHDGSAESLEEVLERAAKSGKHGAVLNLPDARRQDLLAYLLSL